MIDAPPISYRFLAHWRFFSDFIYALRFISLFLTAFALLHFIVSN